MNPKTKIPVSANMSHSSSRSPNLLSQFFFPTMCPLLLLLFITLETDGSTKSVGWTEQGICHHAHAGMCWFLYGRSNRFERSRTGRTVRKKRILSHGYSALDKDL